MFCVNFCAGIIFYGAGESQVSLEGGVYILPQSYGTQWIEFVLL